MPNLLEHYIEEIKSVEPYTGDWTKEFDQDFVKVIMTANCYGNVREYDRVFEVKEWEKVKRQGYFWA